MVSSLHKNVIPAETAAVYEKPDRYAGNWREMFEAQYRPFLAERMTILDVGSGRKPAIPVDQRPLGCTYIGLDISSEELETAGPGSYDHIYVYDLVEPIPDLYGQVDLVVSWQVLEHITPLAPALDNIHAYLRPGGHFTALLSGRNAVFAVMNRLIPERVGVFAMRQLLKRPPDSVFRAHYDACTYGHLTKLLESWTEANVIPVYRGGIYFRFSRIAQAVYLRYENWIARKERRDLATHYVINARK